MAPSFNYTTTPQKGKYWDGSAYREVSRGYDGGWWTKNDNGEWVKIDKNQVILQFKNPWEGVYSGINEQREKSLEYIEHCEKKKNLAEKAAAMARQLKKDFTRNFYAAYAGIKKAEHDLALLLPSGKDYNNLSTAKQNQVKKCEQEIAQQTKNKDIASGQISEQNGDIRINDGMYLFYCNQELSTYSEIAEQNNIEAIARHMEAMG